MTVYVDQSIFPYRGKLYCHMWSPDVEELHAMAEKIGLRRSWFQAKRDDFKHYDLSPSKRRLAVLNGAEEVTSVKMAVMVERQRVVDHYQTITEVWSE